MTTTAPRKYIRAEPPALLTEPLTVTLQGTYLEALNELRQAKHAMFAHAPGEPGWKPLSEAHDEAEARLGRLLESLVSLELGEPSDWVVAE
ncbi:hypothetical protein [Pseudomonas viridiflava]|uniref:hypothetical protein n=1 Tax=Pseudomonas viridiflava TaxID=33069 RepID=UPI000F05EE6D|nr:hypothetical protein [Pseudomonas viridiflava]